MVADRSAAGPIAGDAAGDPGTVPDGGRSRSHALRADARVLCVHQGYELYGSDRSFLTSVQLLRDAYPAATIDLLLPREGDLTSELRRIEGVRTIVGEVGNVRSSDAARPLAAAWRTVVLTRRAVRRAASYDALYVNTVVVADYILATRFLRARSVIHVREIPPSRAAKLVLSLLLAASPAFKVFNSEHTRQAYWFVPRASCATVHNGVEGFAADPVDTRPDAPLRVLLIGRISAGKGQDFLVDAVARLTPDERRRLRVRIVGDAPDGQGAWREDLGRRVKAAGLGETVELRPFVADPSGHFAWSDVVVVPSTRPESFGRVAVEAMSAGRPVVAADHGGLGEIVRHGVTGLLFRPNDATELLACLRRLQADRALLAEMGTAGRARFEAEFSVATYRARLLRVLQRVWS